VITPRDASPAWCRRLISEFDAADERAIGIAETLTSSQLNWKRNPSEWSVGQCLEHLAVANEVYLRAIADSLTDCPHAVVEDITPGWFARWFIRTYIEPSPRSRRARAPAKIAPGATVDPSVLERFLESNDQAREVVHRAGRVDVNRIRFRNPFVPLVRFTVGTGLEIIAKHQRRHLLQAERIRASPELPR
jgi:hypothetical protein